MKKFILISFLFVIGYTHSQAQCFANATSFNSICDTTCNGSIFIQFGVGQPPYSVSVNGGPPVIVTSAFQQGGLCPGVYQFVAIDANNDTCTGMNVVTVMGSSNPSIVINVVDASCPGCSDGAASVIVSGGTPPYSYLWSNGATGQGVSGLPPGTYFVNVTDTNGCSVQESFVVGVGNNGFYTLEGEVYLDLNSNGIKDLGEQGLANQVVQVQPRSEEHNV